jgi:predicted ester cyclase
VVRSKPVDETVATLQHVWDTLPGARFDLKNVVADGPVVAIEFDFVWDDSRPAVLDGHGGEPVERRTPVVDVFHVIDGKLAGLRAYMNSDLMHAWLDEMGGSIAA